MCWVVCIVARSGVWFWQLSQFAAATSEGWCGAWCCLFADCCMWTLTPVALSPLARLRAGSMCRWLVNLWGQGTSRSESALVRRHPRFEWSFPLASPPWPASRGRHVAGTAPTPPPCPTPWQTACWSGLPCVSPLPSGSWLYDCRMVSSGVVHLDTGSWLWRPPTSPACACGTCCPM